MGISLSEIIPQYKINLHNPDTWHNLHDDCRMPFRFSLLYLKSVVELQAKKKVITGFSSYDLDKTV